MGGIAPPFRVSLERSIVRFGHVCRETLDRAVLKKLDAATVNLGTLEGFFFGFIKQGEQRIVGHPDRKAILFRGKAHSLEIFLVHHPGVDCVGNTLPA